MEIGALPSQLDKIKAIVDGTVSPFSQLSEITDWATIKKVCCMNLVPLSLLTVKAVPQTEQRVGSPIYQGCSFRQNGDR